MYAISTLTYALFNLLYSFTLAAAGYFDLLQMQSMQDADIPCHVERIYLFGTNTPNILGFNEGGSWIFPTCCPQNLRPMLKEKQYLELAAIVTKAMVWEPNSAETLLISALHLLVPAHGAQFLVCFLLCSLYTLMHNIYISLPRNVLCNYMMHHYLRFCYIWLHIIFSSIDVENGLASCLVCS